MFPAFGDPAYPVFEFNGTAWTRVVPPIALQVSDSRTGGRAFWDPVRRLIGLPIISNNLNPNIAPSTSTVVFWNGAVFERGNTSLINDFTGTVAPASEGPVLTSGDLTAFDSARRALVWFDNQAFLNSGPASTREMHFSAKAKPVLLPTRVNFSVGGTITLTVISAGRRPLFFQWLKNGVPVLDGGNLTGAGTANLSITAATAADAGQYSVRVTNLYNQVETAVIQVTPHGSGVAIYTQGSGLILSWPGTGILESAPDLAGPWTKIYGATPPYSVALDEQNRYYRVVYP